ncbi:MAG: RraA family protein [Chloroflexi bacterium]|nr:RraA family protein [Chloroflexota bacterium]
MAISPTESASAEFLRTVPSTILSDVLTRVGLTTRMVGLDPLRPGLKVFGRAFTMRYAPKRGFGTTPYGLYKVLNQVSAGQVLVVDGLGATLAVWGELATLTARRQGAVGAVLDGCTRDAEAIRDLGFPVFSRGVHLEAYGSGIEIVGVNETIHCCGAQVRANDLLVGDDDGVVVVPSERIDEVAEAARLLVDLESEFRARLDAGAGGDELQQLVMKKYAKG